MLLIGWGCDGKENLLAPRPCHLDHGRFDRSSWERRRQHRGSEQSSKGRPLPHLALSPLARNGHSGAVTARPLLGVNGLAGPRVDEPASDGCRDQSDDGKVANPSAGACRSRGTRGLNDRDINSKIEQQGRDFTLLEHHRRRPVLWLADVGEALLALQPEL
jgi:hypothetical protein